MPIPPDTKIRHDLDYWDDDGEYMGGDFTLISVPCPTQHIGASAIKSVRNEFLSIVEASYDPSDGGFISIYTKKESDVETIAEVAEDARDNARKANGLNPYEPHVKDREKPNIGQSTNKEDEDDDRTPRGFH